MFCAVLAWSRVRFVRFAGDESQATTLRLLAECFETLGGVPAVVLADRMGCLKGGVVANVVVPAPGYVAFAVHYGFRPDFCEAADPESKGIVEHLVGYAKADLVVPAGGWDDLGAANEDAAAWCAEVNGRLHSEIAAVPAERLARRAALLAPLPSLRPAPAPAAVRTVDRLRTVRYGSARYSVPGEHIGRRVEIAVSGGELVVLDRGTEVARHRLVGPGETSLARRPLPGPGSGARPRRSGHGRQPRSPSWGWARSPPRSCGPPRRRRRRGSPGEIAAIADLEAAHGREPLVAALEPRARVPPLPAADVRSILAAGQGVPRHREPGAPLAIGLPAVPVRPLAAYAAEAASMSAAAEALAPDLEAALRRLKLAAVRRLAPEVLATAKVQRWAPDELLRTLLEAELARTRCLERPGTPAGAPASRCARRSRSSWSPTAPSRGPPSTTSPASSGSGPARTSCWSDRRAPARAIP